MLSLNYPYTTKDGTKLYPTKPVKGLIEDYKGSRDLTYRSQRFSSEVVLMKGYIIDAKVRDMRRR